MEDSGNLQNLNDIVLPPAVPWWPPAPGWYLVAAILLILLAWTGWRTWRRWQRNRYRREALRELSSMRTDTGSIGALPGLLKRTALAAWPRTSVASLSGPDWHRYLDDSAGLHLFRGGAGEALDRLSYSGDGAQSLPDESLQSVLQAAETWLRRHRAEGL